MHHVRQESLPFVGSSHEFVGAEQGDTHVSVFLFQGKPGPGGKPGSGPGLHRHPYDEIQFIREGRGVWTVNGKTFEGSAGDIFVIKAGEIDKLLFLLCVSANAQESKALPQADERYKADILVVVAHPDDEGAVTPYHGCFELVRFFRKLSAALVRNSLQQPGKAPARRHCSHV